jgi:hypothetical protein
MAFVSFNSRVVEHRTRFVCLGETPSPRVRCLLALFTYLLTYDDPRWLSYTNRIRADRKLYPTSPLLSTLSDVDEYSTAMRTLQRCVRQE